MNYSRHFLHILFLFLNLTTCSSLPYGKLIGELTAASSKGPIQRGTIVPCWIENNIKATAVVDLATEVDHNGKFEISNLPPGKYVLLYSTTDSSKENLKRLDGLSIPLSLSPFLNLVRSLQENGQVKDGMISKTIPSEGILDDIEGSITIQAGSTFDYDNNGLISGGKGSLHLTEYGFSVNYEDGKITSLKMPSRGVVDVSIEAWGL